jgi:glutaredoxin 3
MAKKITIYTTDSCAYCAMVKKWLNLKGYSYEEVNIEAFPERAQEAIDASGQLTVPITIVTKADDTQVVVVGYNLSRLAPAVA